MTVTTAADDADDVDEGARRRTRVLWGALAVVVIGSFAVLDPVTRVVVVTQLSAGTNDPDRAQPGIDEQLVCRRCPAGAGSVRHLPEPLERLLDPPARDHGSY